MGLSSKKILQIPITISPKEHILEEIRKYLGKVKSHPAQCGTKIIKPLVIFTPNPEIITYAQKNLTFKQIVASSQINIPDGAGICWALAKKHHISVSRLTGTDFMQDLSKFASLRGFRIGIIGGRGGVAVDSLKCLKRQYPGLSGWAMEGPEFQITSRTVRDKLQMTNKSQNSNDQIKEIVEKIRKEKTDILFVALGFPKQEYFIDLIKKQLSITNYQLPIILMAVGGALDYISGRVTRAPKLIRGSGLEWLYRLIREPWRLPRQLKGAEFFYRVMTSSF